MASSLIHIAVAKELEKKILKERNIKIKKKYDYYLGSIAPDLARQIGGSKYEAHFFKNSSKENVPNIDLFVKKYPNFKSNSFDLGYFTHLYVDKLWSEEILNKIIENNSIKLLDGTILKTTKEEEIKEILYSDYTNLNIQLIDEYSLDLSLFYEEFRKPKTAINQIPVEYLDILINKMGIIIENSKTEKSYSIEIEAVKDFIKDAVDKIEKELEKY